VVFTGDIHSNYANDLLANFEGHDGPPVGSEFVGTSISSGGDGFATSTRRAHVLAENPFVKFHNAQRGYVRCTLQPKQWRADFQVLEYVTRPGSPISTAASFVVEAGQPGIKPA
jgi:alkaline phosphatase D